MHPQWIHELIEEIGEGGLSLSDTALHEHSSDQSHHPGIRPVVIVSPASTEDVVPTPGTCRRINGTERDLAGQTRTLLCFQPHSRQEDARIRRMRAPFHSLRDR